MATAKSWRLMLVVVTTLLVHTRFAHAGYATGFESGEGFVPGPIDGQLGWQGDAANPADTVLTTNPYTGSRSLRISADGLFDGAFHLGAAAPAFASPAGRYVYASQDIVIDSTNEADFLIQTVDTTQNATAVQLQFTYRGDLIVNGLDSGYDWQPEKMMRVAIEHDRVLATARILIDDIEVLGGVSIAGVDSINSLQYATDDAVGTTAASLYVDNIAVFPEPASAMLLMAGGLVLLSRHSRTKPR